MGALVQDDEPLDEGEGEDDLPGHPEEARRAQGQGYAQRGAGPDRRKCEAAREVRRAQMPELNRARPGRMHDSSFHGR